MKIRAASASATLVLMVTLAAQAATTEVTVLRVIDGDSLQVQSAPGGEPIEVRLEGIDAPEGCQDGGPEARAMLAEFVLDKPVSMDTKGKDHYGRTLATVSVDGVNVNQRLVAEGQAWSLRTKWDRGPYVTHERMAQALKRGLHAGAKPERPDAFRRRHGPCRGAPTEAPAPKPAVDTAAPPPPASPTGWRCDGRTHCSQMRSCEEATYFLKHCPGVKMDGNQDGVPCERQWCRR